MNKVIQKLLKGKAGAEKKQIPSIYFAIGMLIFFILVFSLFNPSFFKRYNIMTIGTSSMILLAVGLGQVFTILTGGIDLSVGGIMSLVSVVFMITLEPLGYGAYPVALFAGARSRIPERISEREA